MLPKDEKSITNKVVYVGLHPNYAHKDRAMALCSIRTDVELQSWRLFSSEIIV